MGRWRRAVGACAVCRRCPFFCYPPRPRSFLLCSVGSRSPTALQGTARAVCGPRSLSPPCRFMALETNCRACLLQYSLFSLDFGLGVPCSTFFWTDPWTDIARRLLGAK
ncbi:hypothetical protein TW95_gp1302 [Pandoravirus inopinatum]|uniref:Uncharacterized protein n=1 Tax=Pandoravirus inopinatum TaxID=1605721 RepID=A0A0B5JAP3_9VIRU|nr:hypothetical protein TW95_gp1302 [Pandoravirus inopinatum]AJF98036.1 hypothetical protein [Pandoravirus inopinatum]